MKFEKINNYYLAVGEFGTFKIQKLGGFYYSKYTSADKSFNLPRKKLLADAKTLCEENYYWED